MCPYLSPGRSQPLFRGTQPEQVACLDPLASRMATTRRGLLSPSSLRVIWSSRLWVLGGSAAGGLPPAAWAKGGSIHLHCRPLWCKQKKYDLRNPT